MVRRFTLTLAVACALAGVVVAQPAQDARKARTRTLDEMLLFFPLKHPGGNWQPQRLEFEDVDFKAGDGTRLHGWFCPCKDARAVLLYAHGNAGNLTFDVDTMRHLHDLKIASFFFDYRGYGKSAGTPTVDGILQDGRAARTWLAGRTKVKEADIVLMGRSLGGAVAARLAGEAPARALILESTFTSLHAIAEHHYGMLAAVVPKDRLNSVAQLARHAGPLLISHGDADSVIPFTMGQKLFDTAKGVREFIRIPKGGHNNRHRPEYWEKLDQFIGKLPDGPK